MEHEDNYSDGHESLEVLTKFSEKVYTIFGTNQII